jgi:DNA-directed RNA polymerase specialized sigma24 family protein
MNWEALYQRLLRQFRVEDVVQEAILRTQARLVVASDIHDVEAFAVGVARNVVRENVRDAQRHNSYQVTASDVPHHPAPLADEQRQHRLEEIKRQALSTSECKLFDTYYRTCKTSASREKLARKLGITVDTLYVRMFRLKQRVIQEYRRQHGVEP